MQRSTGGYPYLSEGIPQPSPLRRVQTKVRVLYTTGEMTSLYCNRMVTSHTVCHSLSVRYAILAPKAIPAGFMDGRKACEQLISALQLETSEYRLGNSKVRHIALQRH